MSSRHRAAWFVEAGSVDEVLHAAELVADRVEGLFDPTQTWSRPQADHSARRAPSPTDAAPVTAVRE